MVLFNRIFAIAFQRISPDEPYCSIYNEVTSSVSVNKLKGSDHAYVDYVAVDVKNRKHIQKVSTQFPEFDLSIFILLSSHVDRSWMHFCSI